MLAFAKMMGITVVKAAITMVVFELVKKVFEPEQKKPIKLAKEEGKVE